MFEAGTIQPVILPFDPVRPEDEPGEDGRVEHSNVRGANNEVEYIPEDGYRAKGGAFQQGLPEKSLITINSHMGHTENCDNSV